MKFTCDRAAILREIAVAQEIVAQRNALSILSNVLFEVQEKTLTIKATDLKVGFETQLPVDTRRPGTTTVYCDKLLDILRSLPDGDVEFDQSEGKLVIRPLGKKIDFRLKSIASEKFPENKTAANERYFSFAQADFIRMIDETIFAVSDDESRYFMNGVYLESRETKLVMVATDGRRLSIIEREGTNPIGAFDAVIVPPKILSLARKLATGEGNLQIAVSEKHIFLQIGGQRIWSTLIEGQFPNYRRVIPESQTNRAVLRRDEFTDALKRVSVLVEQKSRRIYLKLEPGEIVVRSEETEVGSAEESLPCKYDGPAVSIALSYVYLTEPLKVMEGDEVAIEFTEPTKALTILPLPTKDYFHVVMPMVE